jgi:hypothetical protein
MYPPEEAGVAPSPENEGKGIEDKDIQEPVEELAVAAAVAAVLELAGNQDEPEVVGKLVTPGPVVGERRP